ncbi:MAG: Type III pantothenate kinase [Steroidobacteraceae bacterium]|nr:Type III pantothenate kinase [Steroidobacteraceae bacterium]
MSRTPKRPAARRTLLLDVGNSRIKWALLQGERIGRQHAIAVRAHRGATLAPLLRALPPRLGAIRIVSVARKEPTRRLTRALRRASGADVKVLVTTARAAGVRCGYREPWRLGVDRWAAVVGAYHLDTPARAQVVVDVGTALTIDFVSRAGQHGGGVIVPSPGQMVAGLLRGTHGIRARAARSRRRGQTLFARSTHEALLQGSRHAAAALIERACAQAAQRYGSAAVLTLTGGGVAELLPWLTRPYRVVPDLVLRGLARLA